MPKPSKKLVIVMANSDPRNGEELGAPIFQAALAAAMGYDVEVLCTGTAGKLMKRGVAEGLHLKPGMNKSIYDFIREAHEAGVRFCCCSPALDMFAIHHEDLIPECDRVVGGAALIEGVMGTGARVLTY